MFCCVSDAVEGVVEADVSTLQVPYGSSFYQDIQFLAQARGAGGCRLRVTAEVKFTKRVLGIGGIIKSSATKASSSSLHEHEQLLMLACYRHCRWQPDPRVRCPGMRMYTGEFCRVDVSGIALASSSMVSAVASLSLEWVTGHQ